MSAPEKRTVLVVDDSKMMLRIYQNQFHNSPFLQNFEVKICASALECLNILGEMEELPCLIILDWIMPGPLDGLGLLKKFKESKNYTSIPVMMVSSVTDKAKIINIMQHGAKDYLIKPINTSQFVNKITALTSSS